MADLVLALDLGTGGCKSSLWSAEGECVAEAVADYPTSHPGAGLNEQRPQDWWDAVVSSTRALLAEGSTRGEQVAGVAISGHSLGAVLLDRSGRPVLETTPIWSDTRAVREAEEYFSRVDQEQWYATTGNGFSPALYPVFKAMWFRRHEPEAWARTRRVVGSKDYVNLLLTGVLVTDPSYASGSGCFDLRTGRYDLDLLAAADLDAGLLPEVGTSTDVVGGLTAAAAEALGLPAGLPVVSGGVDNACMALGSRGGAPGRVYASLGSSSWVTVTAEEPVVDLRARPFVFAHVVPGLFISALSTFSTGTTLTWLRDLVAPSSSIADLLDEGCTAPPGARGLLFLPMLAGGTPLEGGTEVRGALHGLDLSHRRADVVRAAMEGISASLVRSRNLMASLTPLSEELLISGGGSQHAGWNQISANLFGVPLVRTAVDQQAAALGAAATAFVGLGLWEDFTPVDRPHRPVERYEPVSASTEQYAGVRRRFDAAVAASATVPRPDRP